MTTITSQPFGCTKDGFPVEKFTLTNSSGASVSVLSYGATIQSIVVPDRDGKLEDVVLGCDTVQDYEAQTCYFGATVGRVANRIGGAEVKLDGKLLQLDANENGNTLHGGFYGFDKWVWELAADGEQLSCQMLSPAGDSGFPGNLRVEVRYSWSDDNRLTIQYRAVSDDDTLFAPTNHSYFNLGGQDSGDILQHQLQINAAGFTEIGKQMLPTGTILPVKGSALDFTTPQEIGARIDSDHPQMKLAGGYDHNFVLDSSLAAVAFCPASGRKLTVSTTMPGMQLYTGNFIGDVAGKGGVRYHNYSGFALETQLFADAMAHPNFSSPILRAGEVFTSTTSYHFEA